jgi:hypothetical protein
MGKRGPKRREKAEYPLVPAALPAQLIIESSSRLACEVKEEPNFLRLSSTDRRSLLGILEYAAKNQRLSSSQLSYLTHILERLYRENQAGTPGSGELTTNTYRRILANSR